MGCFLGKRLVVAGGAEDPQLGHFAMRAEQLGATVQRLLHAPRSAPLLSWDLESGLLTADGATVEADAAFVRQDVFGFLKTKRGVDRVDGRSWKITFDGWLWSRPDIAILNRGFIMRSEVNKPLALVWAKECGLPTPRTAIIASKAAAQARLNAGSAVYKPVGGGDLCRVLEETALRKVKSAHLPRPYIVQQLLEQPELRIFRVGKRLFGFSVVSDVLDYRADNAKTRVTAADVPPHLMGPLMELTDRLGLDYSAADFKTCPETGELKFLEANSNPMFVAFDKAAGGALTAAMLDVLLNSTSQ